MEIAIVVFACIGWTTSIWLGLEGLSRLWNKLGCKCKGGK